MPDGREQGFESPERCFVCGQVKPCEAERDLVGMTRWVRSERWTPAEVGSAISDVRWAIESGVAKGGMVDSLNLALALLLDEAERWA